MPDDNLIIRNANPQEGCQNTAEIPARNLEILVEAATNSPRALSLEFLCVLRDFRG